MCIDGQQNWHRRKKFACTKNGIWMPAPNLNGHTTKYQIVKVDHGVTYVTLEQAKISSENFTCA